jgi:hypothetical protein
MVWGSVLGLRFMLWLGFMLGLGYRITVRIRIRIRVRVRVKFGVSHAATVPPNLQCRFVSFLAPHGFHVLVKHPLIILVKHRW